MSRFDKFLCAIYALLAILALYATWVNNLAFLALPEGQTIAGWFEGVYANYAAASFTNDLLFLTAAVCVFIVIEGRRLKIRFYLAYISSFPNCPTNCPLTGICQFRKNSRNLDFSFSPSQYVTVSPLKVHV